MNELKNYALPGNIRELEHLIERSVLLTTGKLIQEVFLPPPRNKESPRSTDTGYTKTMEENEQDHLIDTLNKCNGKVYGAFGSANLFEYRFPL